mgnify:CR=1 FL=1|tara:strand:+ start:33336 stop:34466 length:1131 start_codon:yes stop_codon:yes gene_type:complete
MTSSTPKSGSEAEYTGPLPKVLIIDGNKPNRELLSYALGEEKLEVISAGTGAEGLETAAKIPPDLVLLDMNLPHMKGLDVCTALREIPGNEDMPVLLMMASSTDQETTLKSYEAGASGYITKPFKLQEIAILIKLHIRIYNLVKKLRKANLDINRLLGIATHDLRNPLVSIRGLAEVLKDGGAGELNKEQKEILDTMHTASESVLFLVENLLDFSDVEEGLMKVKFDEFDLLSKAQAAIKVHQMTADKKGIKLNLVTSGEIRPIQGDKNRIPQVIDNLITNAIKFSEHDSTVTIEISQNDKHTTFSVKDQGQGIPQGEEQFLFTSFGKTSVRPTGGEKSTGLGLVICKKIVDSHGGEITAGNNPKGGAVFTVTFKN